MQYFRKRGEKHYFSIIVKVDPKSSYIILFQAQKQLEFSGEFGKGGEDH